MNNTSIGTPSIPAIGLGGTSGLQMDAEGGERNDFPGNGAKKQSDHYDKNARPLIVCVAIKKTRFSI
jgi:hypothetical protein